eukprot:gnl/TRDRNA2_/TRDRNA2_42491_c0_seq1.p1 gnl/TRDRNA2_/TRDRNA2_42491_c0~~gnl/TRDRNA2_/TRDRNA2_42491_c0_seq1.p1  ORF type:complete len:893 (-),score=194.86 gnl/TRDRNA2_/TRDRNA2_42491_c0_seq1:84-2762(-)
MTESEQMRRCASLPIGSNWNAAEGMSMGSSLVKALVLTTPRNQRRPRSRPSVLQPLQPFSPSGNARAATAPHGQRRVEQGEELPSPTAARAPQTAPATPAGQASPAAASGMGRRRSPSTSKREGGVPGIGSDSSKTSFWASGATLGGRPDTAGSGQSELEGNSDGDIKGNTVSELSKLRKRLHQQACELQKTRDALEFAERELRQSRSEADDLRLKLTSLERLDRTKSAELLEERRKNDELSKQVKEMSANMLSLCGNLSSSGHGGADSNKAPAPSSTFADVSGLRKRCFKLVQQNTELTVQARLLRRQKGWAEAKARVLQNEVTRVYLGTHDQVKDARQLDDEFQQEFDAAQSGNVISNQAEIYQMLLPMHLKHQEAVIDFLTHITHTHGHDIHGFLQSSKVFSDGIRNECLNGLSSEFYLLWRRNRQLPSLLRSVERIVHLSDLEQAFESFSSETQSLLGCGYARIWVVDRTRHCCWTCRREGDDTQTDTLSLPRGSSAADLQGASLVAAAYATQKPVIVSDAREDVRYRADTDAGLDGHVKSLAAVPVMRHNKVRVVLQAINKLKEPQFDADNDIRILRLIGKVSMEVLQVCETSSAKSVNSQRKDSLLQLLNDHIPCNYPAAPLHALDLGLHEIFGSQATALHLVETGDVEKTCRIVLDRQQRKITKIPCDSLKGIVGYVAKKLNPYSLTYSQLEKSRYDPAVDLPAPDRTVIHTVPICEGSGCAAVCQFVCMEKERMIVSDDGSYNPHNTSHFRLLSILLSFVQKHLYVINEEDVPPPKKAPPPKESEGTKEVVSESEKKAAEKEPKKSIDSDDDDEANVEGHVYGNIRRRHDPGQHPHTKGGKLAPSAAARGSLNKESVDSLLRDRFKKTVSAATIPLDEPDDPAP